MALSARVMDSTGRPALGAIRPAGRSLRMRPRAEAVPPPRAARGIPELSPREREIARLVADGLVNKTIGSVLDISPWTVATHLRRMFAKLRVSSRAAMIAAIYDNAALEREPEP
jgi:DNA-binding CsgD family transcriptional regulator